jgi:hypothetical protein
MADQTVNIPQLILILVLGVLAIRYFFFSSSVSATNSQTRGSAAAANNVRAREADVERIQQMFPQVSRRCIMWDLQRNGGNVVATTERILSGRGLEVVSGTFYYLLFLFACQVAFWLNVALGMSWDPLVFAANFPRVESMLTTLNSLRSHFSHLYQQHLPLTRHPRLRHLHKPSLSNQIS